MPERNAVVLAIGVIISRQCARDLAAVGFVSAIDRCAMTSGSPKHGQYRATVSNLEHLGEREVAATTRDLLATFEETQAAHVATAIDCKPN